jgi:hypothetical protein
MDCALPLSARIAGDAEGAELVAIFTVLGLGLLGGGIFAIYEGWPYLVLERGFTQVIIGTVAATSGLLMLSLAWVLRELKAMRSELAAALAPADLAAYVQPGAAPALAVPPPAPPAAEPAPASLGQVLGVGAAAVGAGAVAANGPSSEEGGQDKASAQAADRDLFGALVAERLSAEPSADPETAEPEPETEEPPAVPDLFAPSTAEKTENAAAVWPDDESHEPAEIVAAKVQPLSQDEALAKIDSTEAAPVETGLAEGHAAEPETERETALADPAEVGTTETLTPSHTPAFKTGAVPIYRAEPDPQPDLQPLSTVPEPEVDEFRALRESLTSELGYTIPAARGSDPAFGLDKPEPHGDEAFFPASGRREPSFAPLTAEPEAIRAVDEDVLPAWPPRTVGPAPDEPLPHPGDEVDASAFSGPEELAESALPSEPEASVPEERASSEEGIVGAYQVGDAHFTIFADGSIRARTPDGEYSFASMDELKLYLASEKSRLGV